MPAKITFTWDQSAERELAERAERMKPHGPPLNLTPKERAVLFLRGVNSRATLTLPAFYLFHGARFYEEQATSLEGYPGVVLKHALEFSSIGTVSLSCRKVFDDATKGLTGGSFAKISDKTLMDVAEYWSDKSKRPNKEALAALVLLRSVFQDCATKDSKLLNATYPLCKRIGLLKQYANRSAAHLSLDSYEFTTLDCAHVVAALTVIGEIIRSFDRADALDAYYNDLDEASLAAAKHLFPGMPDIRLFDGIKIEEQSRLCWQWGAERGRRMLFEQLPYATGWF